MLSVIIPSLNAEETLGATVQALRAGADGNLIREIILVDGGSTDGTVRLAHELGIKTLRTRAGRGHQLAYGAIATHTPWLLFLHADTCLEPDFGVSLRAFIESVPERELRSASAAVFHFGLDDERPAARRLEHAVEWRTRILGLPYGDQGLLISKERYVDLGGFKSLPMMEDVDIVRRLGRKNIQQLAPRAVTSAARFKREGFLFRSSRNLLCLALFYLGVPIRVIQRIYG